MVVGELEQFTCSAHRIASITLIVHNTPTASHGQAQKGCVVAALSYTEEIIQDRQPCIDTAQDRFRCRSRSSPTCERAYLHDSCVVSTRSLGGVHDSVVSSWARLGETTVLEKKDFSDRELLLVVVGLHGG